MINPRSTPQANPIYQHLQSTLLVPSKYSHPQTDRPKVLTCRNSYEKPHYRTPFQIQYQQPLQSRFVNSSLNRIMPNLQKPQH
jgi:hypothetical protein